MVSPLPLAASNNSELNLKAIFRPGRFWDASNNQRMASALPCLDLISIGTFCVYPFLLCLIFIPILGVTLRIAPSSAMCLNFAVLLACYHSTTQASDTDIKPSISHNYPFRYLAHALTWSIFLKFHGLAASAEAVFPKLNKRANKIKEFMRNQTERETRLMAHYSFR